MGERSIDGLSYIGFAGISFFLRAIILILLRMLDVVVIDRLIVVNDLE